MQSEPEDSDLIREFLKSRAEHAFRMLYRRHTPALYLFALRLTGGLHHDAEDVVQETWIRAIRGLPGFVLDAKLIRWLMGIASNCHRELRRANRPAETSVPSQPNPDARAHDLERFVRVLPDGCRQVLILHDLCGYTHEEIAGLLDIAAGTSKSQLFEARQKLRAQLAKEKQ